MRRLCLLACLILGPALASADEATHAAALARRAALDAQGAAELHRADLAERPDYWPARIGLIRNLADAGDVLGGDEAEPLFAEAMALAAELVAAHPDSAEAHYLLALASGQMALYAGGKDKVRMSREIKIAVDRAIALAPDHADALLLRGVYYYELATLGRLLRVFAKVLFGGLPPGSLADSRTDLEHVLAVDPDHISAHYNLARTLWRLKEAEAAQALCERCVLLTPRLPTDPGNQREAEALQKDIRKKLARRRAEEDND